MEEREPELPVATLRPGRVDGRLTSWRGALGRWLRTRITSLEGRHAPFLLTGIVFSAMMLAMGYVADRANRAADAIDEVHRLQKARMAYESAQAWSAYDLEVAEPAAPLPIASDDPWPAATARTPVATPLFYIRGR